MNVPLYYVIGPPFDHIQLSIGMIHAFIDQYKGGLLEKYYRSMPHVVGSVSQINKIAEAFGPGVWLFSNYVWTIKRSIEISSSVKAIDRRNLTVYGGPSAPKYPEANESFLRANQHVDYTVRGEGEVTAADLLENLIPYWENGGTSPEDLSSVESISYLHNGGIVRTHDRKRIESLDEIPSPYLAGLFDKQLKDIRAAILETNRGCPYRCAFCDWGSLTSQKIKMFDLQRVYAELEWIGKHEIPIVFIADANFGIFERDIEIAGKIATTKQQYGYPREIYVNYAKNATKKISEIVNIMTRAGITTQGIIAIQTTDENTLDIINRSNIKSERYDELTEIFRDEELPLSIDLMLALPGSTIDTFSKDLQYFFNQDIRVKAYHTELLPNSPMADPAYMEKYKIKIDEKSRIRSSYSFTPEDVAKMIHLYCLFVWCSEFAFIKYILCYLQWDHGIQALDFLNLLLDQIIQEPDSLTSINPAQLTTYRTKPIKLDNGTWNAFYKEIAEFTTSNFSVKPDTAFETAFLINESVMPTPDGSYPKTIKIKHDFVKYYQDHRKKNAVHKPLIEYLPGEMTIDDTENISHETQKKFSQYVSNQIFWELENPLRRPVSEPFFIEQWQ